MLIPFSEPSRSNYIYINAKTNRVHLMVPVVDGPEISRNNTCKATVVLDDFFQKKGALRELQAYEAALLFDLTYMEDSHPSKQEKQERLAQIRRYIDVINTMGNKTSTALISPLLINRSNLYTIQLRPNEQDPSSRVINPVFTINKSNNYKGKPNSALFNAMYNSYPNTEIQRKAPQTCLKEAVLHIYSQVDAMTFADIQQALHQQCQVLFHIPIDFTITNEKSATSDGRMHITQTSIDKFMGFSPNTPLTLNDCENYVDALIGLCANTLHICVKSNLFYSIPDEKTLQELRKKTEKLSILTQFLLSIINIYCVAHGLSQNNFGQRLDSSSYLSEEVAVIVKSSLECGDNVESNLCTFFDEHRQDFGLPPKAGEEPLFSADSIEKIRQTFERTYRTVTATNENEHMDDFMILDRTHKGSFIAHQNGTICTNFAYLIEPNIQISPSDTITSNVSSFFQSGSRAAGSRAECSNNGHFFQMIRDDYDTWDIAEVPTENASIAGHFEIDTDTLIAKINDDEQFDRLPAQIKQAGLTSLTFQTHTFLHNVARGKQHEAQQCLEHLSDDQRQLLLLQVRTFTDYSGRRFTCTAYEYAYWAKDKHMCRMLETRMDDNTKTQMLMRIDAMEEYGLAYQQDGDTYQSKHFHLTELVAALQNYYDGYIQWIDDKQYSTLIAAWMRVGKAQRDVPAHVAHEYCRPDRSFYPCPTFNENTLRRELTFDNYITDNKSWFPLAMPSSGLGVDFAILRAWLDRGCSNRTVYPQAGGIREDLVAVRQLDAVRSADLVQSRNNLSQASSQISMVY